MYCTKDDLIARGWGEEIAGLSDKAGELGGDINEAVLQQAIDDASAKIDSFLTGLIDLPLLNPSPHVIRCACDMTRFYLYDIGALEAIRNAFDDAVAFFKSVQLRKTPLQALQDLPPEAESKIIQMPVLTAPEQVFSDSLLAKM